MQFKKQLESENERRSAQAKILDIEVSQKESEVNNAAELFKAEKVELEAE